MKDIVFAVCAGTAIGGKVSFRGFRGRYRLAWKDADGKARQKHVDVK